MYITSCGFTGIESHIILMYMYLAPLVALWLLYYGQRVRLQNYSY